MVLQQYMRHLPHINASKDKALRSEGCACWTDLVNASLPRAGFDFFAWDDVRKAAEESLLAMRRDDVAYFVALLPTLEHWRLLAHWFDRASYFDIETSGLEADSIVTLICCFHENRPLRYLAGENLDEFLDLLESVKLLVSFNGASFDVPRTLDRFHISELPCAHVDLRWLCHHAGWRGGLKRIEGELGLHRPPDLVGLGGAEAVWLWHAWSQNGDERARRTLERYCSADTAMLKMLAGKLCALLGASVTLPCEAELWSRIHETFPDLGRPLTDPPVADVERGLRKPAPAPIVTADRFSISEMVGAIEGLTRAEKQARLRERWRKHSGG